jgi:hypothetical protein
MKNLRYLHFSEFLSSCSPAELLASFSEPWLNELIPGLADILGCDQGRERHSEGDVAAHTVLVFNNLRDCARRRVNRQPSFIEQLAAVMHDLKKPAVRKVGPDGSLSFAGHERMAAAEVRPLAQHLDLLPQEENCLFFLVAYHGDAHNILELPEHSRAELLSSPYIESLALLQEADALSCLFPDGSHLPVYWDLLRPRLV